MRKGELSPIQWNGRELRLIDQLSLPRRTRWIACRSAAQVGRAIRKMHVRGAPAIGVAAAYGMSLAARASRASRGKGVLADLERAGAGLKCARPTAVNLAWAVNRVSRAALLVPGGSPGAIRKAVEAEARAIEREDVSANRAIGSYGASLLKKRANVLTHCNTGGLATAGFGTALGIVRAAYRRGLIRRVLVDETRPYLQGARLTAWELKRERIPFILITDSMAGYFMGACQVDAVIVGADRITANGDVANKIGTYSLACLARAHGLPFYVAAPVSTLDLKTPDGSRIPIEERSGREVTRIGKLEIAPPGTNAAHPAFDVTPAALVSAIVTERGVARAPYRRSLRRLVRAGTHG